MIPLASVQHLRQITKNIDDPNYIKNSPTLEEYLLTTGAPTETTFDYQTYQAEFKVLENDWCEEESKVTKRRNQRKIKVNVDELRRKKRVARDETFIPVRVIDNNIRREIPSFIAYLIGSRRVAIFKPKSQTLNLSVDPLESEFTRIFRYAGWETEFFKVLDGAMLHGMDAVERHEDESKPGRVMLRHIGRDKIKFSRDAVSIQACTKIILIYDLSASQLRKFVRKYGWTAVQVDKLLQNTQDKTFDKVFQVRKVFFKTNEDDYIRVAYYHPDCDNWLSAPRPLFLGRKTLVKKPVTTVVPVGVDMMGQPVMGQQTEMVDSWEDVYETKFPVHLLYYTESEEPKILDKEGRAFLDETKQEAATAIRSSIVNRAVRASNVYASPKNQTGVGNGIPSATVNDLVPGNIYNNPLDFWSLPSVDPAIVKVDQYLDTANSAETNQVAFAVNNRDDSRKTATEIQSANRSEAKINTVQVTLFSKFLREICEDVWEMVLSYAQQGVIEFLLNTDEESRIIYLSITYDIFSAGDTDVTKKEEELQRMRMDWPVVSTTAVASMFMAEYLIQAYPDKGNEYAKLLLEGVADDQQKKALLAALGGMVQQFQGQMTPEQQQQMAQLITAVSGGAPKA